MTIYLDVLLLSNLWADYALLRTTARVSHVPLSRTRGLLGAALGAASALLILLPPLPLILCAALRLLTALAVCAASFGLRRLLRRTGVFLLISCIFCGLLYALASLRQPVGFLMQNTVIYADISLMTLLIGTTAAAGIAAFLSRRAERLPTGTYQLRLRISGKDICMPAIADTGNTLRDAFSGKPVAVCTGVSLSLPEGQDTAALVSSWKGFRMLPVETVTGKRLLPAFQPDSAALLRTDSGKEELPLDLMVAVTEHAAAGTPAVIPASLLP